MKEEYCNVNFSELLKKHRYRLKIEHGSIRITYTIKQFRIIYTVMIFIILLTNVAAYFHSHNADASTFLLLNPFISGSCCLVILKIGALQLRYNIVFKPGSICKTTIFSARCFTQSDIDKYVVRCTSTTVPRSSLIAFYTHHLDMRLKDGSTVPILFFDSKRKEHGFADITIAVQNLIKYVAKEVEPMR